MKKVTKPTYIELEQRIKELESELEFNSTLTYHPMPRINSLTKYIDDPSTENMFDCGVEYENKGQTASAIGFYHQCAERAIDNDLLAIHQEFCKGVEEAKKKGIFVEWADEVLG